MGQPILKYSQNLDIQIGPAIEKDLNIKILSVEKIPTGEFNYSYKVTTENGDIIARIFRQRNSPEDGKLEWLEEKLTENNIPHAKMIYYSREDTYFPYGFMVSEFLEGIDGKKAILEEAISFEDFFNKLAVLLQKVHSIQTIGFGELRDGRGEYDTFYDSKIGLYEEIREKLEPLSDIKNVVHKQVLKNVQELQEYKDMFHSVLLHGDPPPDNSILKSDGELILIDWDNAKCGSWIDEYTGLATRGAFMWQHELTEEGRNEIIQRSFKNHYKGVDFNNSDLIAVMKILEILNAYGSLVTHYYQHEDMKLYNIAKERLNDLLDSK